MGNEMQAVQFVGERRMTPASTGTSKGSRLCDTCQTLLITHRCQHVLYVKTKFIRGREREEPVFCTHGFCQYHAPEDATYCRKHAQGKT